MPHGPVAAGDADGPAKASGPFRAPTVMSPRSSLQTRSGFGRWKPSGPSDLVCAPADGAGGGDGVAHRPPRRRAEPASSLRREWPSSGPGDRSRRPGYRRSPAIVATSRAAARDGGGDDAGVLAPERRPGHQLPRRQRACAESYRPPVASLQVWFASLPLLLAKLRPAGVDGGVAGAGGAAAELRRLAMTGRPDWRRPRRLRPALRSLHLPVGALG